MKTGYETLTALLQKSPLFQSQAEDLIMLQEQVERNELVISVVGQFKRGKSSLINVMLGQPLLPVAITPLTAVVTEIRSGKVTEAQVCFRSGKSCTIPMEELGRYCGEKENPHNRKEVQTVKLVTPA